MKQPLKGILIVAVVLAVVAAGAYWQLTHNKNAVPVEVVSTSPPPGTPTSTIATSSGIIRVSEPVPYQEIGLPLVIRGEANTFESSFSWRVRDEDGTILVEGHGMSNAPDVGQFGSFEVSTNYPQPNGTRGTVQVFDYSAKDGSEIGTVSIPVVFKQVDSLTVQAYFSSRTKDPKVLHCGTTYPFDRRIAKTSATARAALEELLRGPMKAEASTGAFTNINEGVKLLSINITAGTAYADFDATLTQGVAGSCRVQAIRSQIENTLKQFPTVQHVIISVNGKTEGVLEP